MANYVPFDGRTPRIQKLEREMNEAAAKRINITYVLTCNLLGRKPDYRDLYDQGVMELIRKRQRILENQAYQNVIQVSRAEPDYRGKTTKISYAKFLRLTDASSVNPYDAFDEKQYSTKMRILREAGYNRLTAKGGKGELIEKLEPSQVLHTFSKVFLSAMRWAKKQNEQSQAQVQAKPKRKSTQKTEKTRQAETRTGRRKGDKQPLLFPTDGKI